MLIIFPEEFPVPVKPAYVWLLLIEVSSPEIFIVLLDASPVSD